MNFSKIMLATAIGFAGGVAMIEYCPKFKEALNKGKEMLSNKNNKK